jgi:hypothetical protein
VNVCACMELCEDGFPEVWVNNQNPHTTGNWTLCVKGSGTDSDIDVIVPAARATAASAVAVELFQP